MDRPTRSDIEKRRRLLVDTLLNANYAVDSAPIRDINLLCDLALQSLSQEAVREEVLEELVPVAAWVYAYTSLGCDPQSAEHMVRAEIARWFDQAHPKVSHPALKPICALAIRALKREPNAAAKIGQSYEVMGIEQTSAPAAPDVARFHGPQDPGFWAAVSDQRFSNEYIGIALRGWLDAQSPKDARSLR